MSPDVTIHRARVQDLPLLPHIERAAAALLVAHVPPEVLRETTPAHVLAAAQSEGRVWVAVVDDVPVGFALVEILDSATAYLAEVDVLPDYGRQGIGARLVATVCEWAADIGTDAVMLTTFREPPWNAPFYARLGFVELPADMWSRDLRAIVEDETRRGFDPARRCVMTRACGR